MAIEVTFRNVNAVIDISSTAGSDFIQIYAPGTKNEIKLDGYLVDFQVRAKLKSIEQFVLPSPEALLTEQTIDNLNYAAVVTALSAGKAKILGIYFSEGIDGIKKWKFSVILWNRIIQYSESILEKLTKKDSAIIAHNTIIWARIEAEAGCTLLSTNDQISISWSAYEEGNIDIADISNLQQKFYTLRLENANQEYNFSIPNGAQGYSFKCRGDADAGDILADIRFAWEPGKVLANEGYDVLPSTSEESEPYLPPQINKILYFAGPANTVILIKIWQQ